MDNGFKHVIDTVHTHTTEPLPEAIFYNSYQMSKEEHKKFNEAIELALQQIEEGKVVDGEIAFNRIRNKYKSSEAKQVIDTLPTTHNISMEEFDIDEFDMINYGSDMRITELPELSRLKRDVLLKALAWNQVTDLEDKSELIRTEHELAVAVQELEDYLHASKEEIF